MSRNEIVAGHGSRLSRSSNRVLKTALLKFRNQYLIRLSGLSDYVIG